MLRIFFSNSWENTSNLLPSSFSTKTSATFKWVSAHEHFRVRVRDGSWHTHNLYWITGVWEEVKGLWTEFQTTFMASCNRFRSSFTNPCLLFEDASSSSFTSFQQTDKIGFKNEQANKKQMYLFIWVLIDLFYFSVRKSRLFNYNIFLSLNAFFSLSSNCLVLLTDNRQSQPASQFCF